MRAAAGALPMRIILPGIGVAIASGLIPKACQGISQVKMPCKANTRPFKGLIRPLRAAIRPLRLLRAL